MCDRLSSDETTDSSSDMDDKKSVEFRVEVELRKLLGLLCPALVLMMRVPLTICPRVIISSSKVATESTDIALCLAGIWMSESDVTRLRFRDLRCLNGKRLK